MNRHDDRSSGRPSIQVLRAVAVAAVLACVGVSMDAEAMGLGRLVVQSALGEPLRAEIEVSAITAEEAASLRSRIAAPDAFRAAGVEYNAALAGATVSLQRRADGRSVLRLASDRAVTEPFIDVILDVEWASGRLSREFTMLFDPPVIPPVASAQVPVVVSTSPPPAALAPAPRAPAPAPVPLASAASAAAPSAVTKPSAAKPVAPAASRPEAAPAGSTEYRVQAGDTLSRIASRNLRPGVSLDQMLVSLYRSNASAFIDENMNRLKVGSVLRVPSGDAASAIPAAEARQVIRAQSADFGAYRSRLAGSAMPAAPSGGRSAAGQLEVSVQDRKTAASETSDRLTLSKGATTPGKGEESLAKAREKNDSAARVAELTRNVEDLKKLKGAASGGVATAPAAPGASSTPGLALPATPAVPLPDPAAPVAASAASTAAPAGSAPQAPAPVSSEPAAAAPPAKASAPAAPASVSPPEEPLELFGDLLDNPMLLPAGGALLALLGLLAWRRLRRRSEGASETSFMESRLQPDSFFGGSGGQRVDTREGPGAPSSMSFSLSQLDAIGDVDPVAEADVYLAYGRDLQAEEILKEAIKVAPDRMAVRLKLLEVYAKRRDVKSSEAVASEIHALTGGRGEDWAKAQQMGAELEPENQLYQPGGKPAEPPARSPAVPTRDGDTLQLPNRAERPPPGESSARAAGGASAAVGALAGPPRLDVDLDLDLDLDLDVGLDAAAPPSEVRAASASPSSASAPAPVVKPSEPKFEPQFEPEPRAKPKAEPESETKPEPDPGLDFSLPPVPQDLPASTAPPAPPEPLDFGGGLLDLDAPAAAAPVAPGRQGEVEALEFSLDDRPAPMEIGLDLPLDEPPAAPMEAALSEALERKLELADEFRQIGDVEGARELVQEVIAQSQGSLKAKAEAMLRGLL